MGWILLILHVLSSWMAWDQPLGASEQEQEREDPGGYYGMAHTWDTGWGHPWGSPELRAALAPLISCPISATPAVCSLPENIP